MSFITPEKGRFDSSQFLVKLPPTNTTKGHTSSTLSILNSLTGDRLIVNSYKFNSLDSLKEFVGSQFGISPKDLFILTPFGIKLKFSMILHDQLQEIYVYNRNCFNLEHPLAFINENLGLNRILKPLEAPILSSEFQQNNPRGNLNTLKRNSAWASALLSDLKKNWELFGKDEQSLQIEIILRSLNVLIQYLSISSQTLQKNLDKSIEFLASITQNSLVSSWEAHYKTLQKIHFKNLCLADLLSRSDLNQIAKEASAKSLESDQIISSTIEKFRTEIESEKLNLEKNFQILRNTHKPQHRDDQNLSNSSILQLQTLVQQVIREVKDLSQDDDLKTCFNAHFNDLTPEIVDLANSLYSKQIEAQEHKSNLQQNLFEFIFKKVAQIQISLFTIQRTISNEIHPRLVALQKLELNLSVVIDLPLFFGILIISKYKNFRWLQNFRKVCFKTNEILEMLQFFEVNARTKWFGKFFGNEVKELTSKFQILDIKETEFVDENMATIQLQFETKGEQKLSMSSSVVNNNTALNKFISSINKNMDSLEFTNLWSTLSVTCTKDINEYIDQLKLLLPNEAIVEKLGNHLNELGFEKDSTFDSEDVNFMKFYKKFLKNFELTDFTIDFVTKSEPVKNKDIDCETIKGYENRIKKLENLLHQQQFLQFNQQFSTSRHVSNPMNVGTLNEEFQNRQQISLPRRFSSETTKTEDFEGNEELQRQVETLTATNLDLLREIEQLKLDKLWRDKEIESLKAAQKDEIKENDILKELELTQMELGIANEEVNDLKLKLKESRGKFEDENSKLKQNYEEVNSMKTDLIENMTSLRKEHEEESKIQSTQIQDLKFQVEALQVVKNEYECFKLKNNEFLNDKNQVIDNLSHIIESMYLKLKLLSQRIFTDFSIFCIILESIGLLLVDEDGSKRIMRVKGLKKSKSIKEELISSEIISKIESNLYWTDVAIEHETSSVKDMIRESSPPNGMNSSGVEFDNSISELDIHSKSLIHKFNNENFEKNYQNFIKSFEIKDDLLITSFTKRFKDVETLARKFQKDLNSLKVENERLVKSNNAKLTIKNFQPNELVLFLPTMEEFHDDQNLKIKQWAIFNIGSPHYFLKNTKDVELQDREWLVARISDIQEHTITEENLNDSLQNPFKLSVGVKWFHVEASEEPLD